MGFGKAAFLSSLLICFGSVASRAVEPEDQKSGQRACVLMTSLAKNFARGGRELAITHLIKGNDAKQWVAEVGRKTGTRFHADEVATVEGRAIAPLVMLIFGSGGCADSALLIRIIPDREI